MAHWKNLSDYTYLGAYSLEGKAQEIVVTITKIAKETVMGPGGKSDECIVGHFEEKNINGIEIKPMVLNKTNCKAIEKALGTGDVDKWPGKKITVFLTETKFQRDMVPCLRVKDVAPKMLKTAIQQPKYECAVCGKPLDKAFYDASVAKYGMAFCSVECKTNFDKANEENENENETK